MRGSLSVKPLFVKCKPKRLPERKAVTVCIAAIAERSVIVGVSDRMLTSGDVEFEPAQAKFWMFSPSIFALVAGDMGIQAEIMKDIHKEVQQWTMADPKKRIKIKDVANLYCKRYREYRRERAEAEVLFPLGLDLQTFIDKQKSLHGDQIEKITNSLIEYDLPHGQEVIFMGIDNDGPLASDGKPQVFPQLYVTMADKLSWQTTVGFAAIGIGKAHAESQMMFYGHFPNKQFNETLLLTYAAKKRAEAAPGVGKETDMLVIGPGIDAPLKVEDQHLAALEKIYQRSRKNTLAGVKRAQANTQLLIDRVRKEYEEREKQAQSELSAKSQKGAP